MPYRLMYRFWLDIQKPEEEAIADKIEVLKNERSFSATIRDGIKLICDLREGKLDILFSMFPWVRAEFLQYMREVAIETPAGQSAETRTAPEQGSVEAERAWLEAEQERLEQERAWEQRRLEEARLALEAERQAIEQERQRVQAERAENQSVIQKQLARLEELLLSQGYQPIESTSEAPSHHPNGGNSTPSASKGPKQLNVPQFAPPPMEDDDDEDDEDLLEMKKDKSAGMRATTNFLNSVKGLNKDVEQPPKTNTSYNTGRRRRYNHSREAGQQ